MSESNEIPDPMPATRKRTSANTAKKAVTVKKPVETLEIVSPTPLLTLEDYKKDFLIRWQIHSYEVDLLGKDLKVAYDFISNQVATASTFIKDRYQAEFSK